MLIKILGESTVPHAHRSQSLTSYKRTKCLTVSRKNRLANSRGGAALLAATCCVLQEHQVAWKTVQEAISGTASQQFILELAEFAGKLVKHTMANLRESSFL